MLGLVFMKFRKLKSLHWEKKKSLGFHCLSHCLLFYEAKIVFKQYSPIFKKCPIFIPPENIRKPELFWCFQGVYKWNIGWKWVNLNFWLRSSQWNSGKVYLLLYSVTLKQRWSFKIKILIHINFEQLQKELMRINEYYVDYFGPVTLDQQPQPHCLVV